MDAFINFVSGVNAGVAVVLVGQPLDTVKVKMQTFPQIYGNAMKCFFLTAKQEGVFRGLYAGTVPSLVANVADNAVLFLFYGLCQKAAMTVTGHTNINNLSILDCAIAGGCSGVFTTFVLCPIELIKCRLQAQYEQKSGIKTGAFRMTHNILKQEGILGLYKGFIPTLTRESPGYFFFFLGLEATRQLFAKKGQTRDDIGAIPTLVSGGVAGASLWTSIYPADVVKSRIQIQCDAGKKSPSFLPTLLKIWREEGFRALYKGFGPTLVRTLPANAAMYWAYDQTKYWANRFAYPVGDISDITIHASGNVT